MHIHIASATEDKIPW